MSLDIITLRIKLLHTGLKHILLMVWTNQFLHLPHFVLLFLSSNLGQINTSLLMIPDKLLVLQVLQDHGVHEVILNHLNTYFMIRYKAMLLKNDRLFWIGAQPIMFDPFKRTRELTTIISNILQNNWHGQCRFSRAWVGMAQLVECVYVTLCCIRWWQWLLNVFAFFTSLIVLMFKSGITLSCSLELTCLHWTVPKQNSVNSL